MTLRVGSLCTGYSGIEIGLRLTGLDFETAWYAEVEPALVPLLATDHPGVPNLGDVTAVDWASVEPVDLIVGGIPCQPTSAAGKRLGDADPRWLWPATEQCLTILRPRQFLLENVRGLVSHDKGRLFDGICTDLVGLGYDVRWLTLGACSVGLAHHRHRVFLLATLSTTPTTRRLDVPGCGATGRSSQLFITPAARDHKGDPSVHRDRGTKGSGTLGESLTLLPTPTSTDARGSRNATSGRQPDSAHHAGETLTDAFWLLPSPTARDGSSGPGLSPSAEGSANLRTTVTLLPTPRASDGVNGGPNQAGRRGDLALPSAVQPERWGRFAVTVARHADAVGAPPPDPTEPNRNGNPRLRPAFVEWLMGVPAGHVTDRLERKAALKALGNGVVPAQCAQAWRLLTDQLPTNYGSSSDTSTPTMTGERMSTSEETRLALKRKDDARRAAVDAALQAGGDYYHHDDAARAIHAAAQVIAESWRAEAISYEGSTKRDQSAKVRQRLRDSAAELLGFTAGLLSPAFIESLSSVETDAQLPAHDANQPVDLMGALRASIPETVAKLADAMEGKTQTVEGSDIHEWTDAHRVCANAPRHGCKYDDATREWYPSPIPAHIGQHPHIEYPCTATDELWLDVPAPVLGDAAAIQSYLKGETDVIPQNAPGTAPVTLPSIVFVDPAPLAPPRMSWDEFAAAIANMPAPDHGSFSMVTSLADCGMAYALDRLARLGQGDVKPPMPAWYLVGGSAFHSAVETIERTVMTEGNLASDFDAGALWRDAFQAEIRTTAEESGVTDPTLWRAAEKGRENYDWWRVQGEDMVRRYVHYHNPEWRRTHQILVMPDGRPALELELTLDLAGWPFKCVIDQVWLTKDALYIDDLKSGKTKQPSTFQLGGYAHALASALANGGQYLAVDERDPHRFTIAGGFYDARAGSHDMEVDDLLAAHPMTELRHRAYAAANMVKAKAYLPRVSNFGGGCTSCGHRAICPAQS